MARIIEYAQMADAVYRPDFTLPASMASWELIHSQRSGQGIGQAFQGAAWRKEGAVIAAFKGTAFGGETSKRDLAADAKLALGMNTYQYDDAMQFLGSMPAHPGCKVTVCGHSLGGAIAQVVGNRARVLFATFNAPGVAVMSRNVGEMAVTAATGTMGVRIGGTVLSAIWHPVQAAQDLGALFHKTRGVNFRLGRDVVGCTGVHYGRVIEIPYTGGAMDVMLKHKMTSMLAALGSSPYAAVELQDVAR